MWAQLNLQVLHNDIVNKIVEQATQEKSAKVDLIFLIDLTMVAEDTKSMEDEPQTFYKAWSHPNHESQRKW